MPLRLIRAYVPSNDAEFALALRSRVDVDLVSIDDISDHTEMEIVVPTDAAEAVVSMLEGRYGGHEGFRILIFPLEASVPRELPEETPKKPDSAPINVEELYQAVRDETHLDWIYAVTLGIASLVAAAGIARSSTELIVASMILAPLLGPNIGIATATALADPKLGLRALAVSGAGIAISLSIGATIGALFGVPMDSAAVTSRMSIGPLDFMIAGTAGVSAALSYTSGAFGRIVGVMIAIALLPPMVLTGMLLGSFDFVSAGPPALVTAINFIAINLCGVVVLFARNVRPRSIYEREKARLAVFASIAVWGAGLVLLIVLVVLANAEGMT